ncbi:hypothetical protein ACLB1M_00285 [Escherichia coli]
MYICTLCCFAEEVKGDYSHYRTFLFDIGNQYKVKLTQSGKKELSLTLEFNDTIIESQKVTGNKAKHILEDIKILIKQTRYLLLNLIMVRRVEIITPPKKTG